MTTQELRINNLVHVNGKVLQVKNVLEKCINYDICVDGGDKKHMDEIEPIPITKEWLDKFGFKFDDENASTIIYKELTYDKKHDLVGNFNYGVPEGQGILFHTKPIEVHIKYVHQLQNFYFSLTGKELTNEV